MRDRVGAHTLSLTHTTPHTYTLHFRGRPGQTLIYVDWQNSEISGRTFLEMIIG